MPVCPGCGLDVSTGPYCVRCGTRLEGEHPVDLAHHPSGRRGFLAAPHEHLFEPRIVSTIFPHLPRSGMATFRLALALGAALIASLALAGLFPVALIACGIVVPLLTLFYFREVDLYEDEPFRVLALTIVWGAGSGVGVGLLADAVRSADAALVSQTTGHAVLWRGVLIPLIGFALALAGPLVLLPYRKFDDVLDGVTFGGASAVAFAGAELLTHSSTFLSSGLEPPGLVTPWVLRLLTLGILVPVLAAASVGSAAGALWLRFRAPARDRGRLGLLGHPAVAVPLATALLLGGALLQLYLGRWAALAALLALDGVALVWLRGLIHLGLMEEAIARKVAPELACPNCGRQTPGHAFCAHCGVALGALPKALRPHLPRARMRLLVGFSVALAALVGLAAGVMAAVEPGSAGSPCPGSGACASPPSSTAGGGPGAQSSPELRTWASSLGTRLSYDARRWHLDATTGRRLQLTYGNQLTLLVEAVPAGGTTPEQLLGGQLDFLRGRYPDLEQDPDPAHQPASAQIGSVPGTAAAFAGHDVDGNPVEAVVEIASAGNVAVVVTVWTSQQAHTSSTGLASPFDVLANADAVLESFRWPFDRSSTAVRHRP